MLNLLTAGQTRAADDYTIQHQPVTSYDLMERASSAFVSAFMTAYPDQTAAIAVYCGTGNNGGDGLAIARLLKQKGYNNISAKIARFSERSTADFLKNYEHALKAGILVTDLKDEEDAGEETCTILIDALLGTGLNKPLEGLWKALAIQINSLNKTVVSVDVPTGFKPEGSLSINDTVILSNLTITFQRPKINFLLPESAHFIQEFKVVEIGLDEAFIESQESPYHVLTEDDIAGFLKERQPFDHKGTFGHALIVAGETQTMGAALLTSEASVYTGAGLTTACIPSTGLMALNVRIPEVMAVVRDNGGVPKSLELKKYSAIAIGPGLGTSMESKELLSDLLRSVFLPVVLDADALNLISQHYEMMPLVPEGSVLTPHVKEFDRLFGEHKGWWDRIETGLDRASSLGVTIVLKNRYTMIFTPDGKCIFNPSGTSAMSTGGMGDVLTGIIASLLAQGYKPSIAAMLGVFLHGAAGESIGGYVVPPSRLLKEIPIMISKFLIKKGPH